MAGMTIGKLAAAGGVGVETVRYYQRRGLLAEAARADFDGGVRRYGQDDARRLRFIRTAQRAGFTLDEIAQLLELDASNDRARVRDLARDRIVALDDRIAELSAARDALAALALECGKGGAGPCPIIAAFER